MDQTINTVNNINSIHDDNCEKCVIGTFINNNEAFFDTNEILDGDCFYNIKYREIYIAIKEITNNGDNANLLTIPPVLEKNGSKITISEIVEISGNVILVDCYKYALRLNELSQKRKMFSIGYYIQKACCDENEDVGEMISSIRKRIDDIPNSKSDCYITLKDSIGKVNKIVTDNLSNERNVLGTETGFKQIDDKGGFQGGNFIVIAGETSQGKTALALSIILNAIRNNNKAAFYSLEMTNSELTSRLLSMVSEISSSKILYGKLSKDELDKFDIAVRELVDKNLFYDDRDSSSIDVIISSIRNMVKKYGIKGAVIDYLQILNSTKGFRGNNDEQFMGEVARRLKNLAKELGIWIVALSQLNRDKENPVPTLSRLRSSGQIAEAADIVMLVYRPEYYSKKYPEPFQNANTEGTAMIDICKGRNIGVTKFLCKFNAKCTLFYPDDNIGFYHAPSNDDSPF